MMHSAYTKTVVVITNNDGTPFREHDFQACSDSNLLKKCKVFVPLNSEYKIKVKNNNDCRIKLDITIDGTTVSGNGLILNKYSEDFLERYVNVAKKFKLVSSDNPAVQDPTDCNNGIIKIKVYKEKPNIYHTTLYWKEEPLQPYSIPQWTPNIGPYPYIFSSTCCSEYKTTMSGSTENVATVEGGESSQTFLHSPWNGNDGEPQIFEFKLIGTSKNINNGKIVTFELNDNNELVGILEDGDIIVIGCPNKEQLSIYNALLLRKLKK